MLAQPELTPSRTYPYHPNDLREWSLIIYEGGGLEILTPLCWGVGQKRFFLIQKGGSKMFSGQ